MGSQMIPYVISLKVKFPYEKNKILVNDCGISERKDGSANFLHLKNIFLVQ